MALDLTAGGRLHVHPLVTENKFKAAAQLIDGATRGNGMARERLKETLASSDLVFSVAQLINIRNLPAYDEAPRQGNLIASSFTVDDFKPATFYSLESNFDNLKYGKGTDGQAGIAPRVAELGTYTYAYGYTEEQAQVAIEKRGFKFGVSLERVVNDPTGEIRRVPGDMLQVGLDTEEFMIFRALADGANASSQMKAGHNPVTDADYVANAPMSAINIMSALQQIPARKDARGRAIPLSNSYYIVVPLGYKDVLQADFDRFNSQIQVVNGNIVTGPTPQGALSRVTGIIESEWIEADGDDVPWYAVPAAGTTRRSSLVQLELAGYTAPEIYVNGFNGLPTGGTADPFTAFSFDNDSVDLKFRMFTNSALISQEQMVWSDGTGVA